MDKKQTSNSTIRSRRLAGGMSQMELAVLAGVSLITVARIETGKTKRPGKRTIRDIEAALKRLEL